MVAEENPFSHEKLSPHHLSLLYPAVFYQNDEALALHLSESCLVENTTWEGENAVGETAFWLKILSTPQTAFLKEQKRLFKTAVADKCKQLCVSVNKLEVSTSERRMPLLRKPKATTAMVYKANKDAEAVEIPCAQSPAAANKPKTVIAVQEPSTSVVLLSEKSNSEESIAPPPQVMEVDQIDQATIDSIASPTPGFGIRAFKCKICDFSTDTRERLKHHHKHSHAPERPFSCHLCDYTSAFPWNIKTHVESVHLKSKKFQCDQCEFASSQACLLRRHINRVHNNNKDLSCPYCNYKTGHRDVLKRHINMKHTKDFAHKCPYCDFGRDAKYEVEDHINAVHLKKVLYQCSDCDFQTYRRITLRSHHKDHEARTLLTCDICNMKTIYPSAMTKHFKSEHPDVEVPPELKSMRKKAGYNSTALSNTDQDYMPVLVCKCKHCGFTTESVQKLKVHVRRVHPNTVSKELRCPVCKMCFASKAGANLHLKKKHPNANVSTVINENAVPGSVAMPPPTAVNVITVAPNQLSGSAGDLVENAVPQVGEIATATGSVPLIAADMSKSAKQPVMVSLLVKKNVTNEDSSADISLPTVVTAENTMTI